MYKALPILRSGCANNEMVGYMKIADTGGMILYEVDGFCGEVRHEDVAEWFGAPGYIAGGKPSESLIEDIIRRLRTYSLLREDFVLWFFGGQAWEMEQKEISHEDGTCS